MRLFFICVLSFFVMACTKDDKKTNIATSVALGKTTFDNHCITCHGKAGAGLAKDWRKSVNGKYPPPPLNGTAHTWHHPPKLLLKSINEGGAKIGGSMPAFADKLNAVEKQALLDYLYSIWPKKIQQQYDSRFK